MLQRIDAYRGYGPFVLRIILGILFMIHGLGKFGVIGDGNLQMVVGFFTKIGMPLPDLTAPLVAAVETIGGLALILGIGTRFVSLILAVVIGVALLFVKLPANLNPLAPFLGMSGWELDLLYIGGLVTLMLHGSGAVAVDTYLPMPAWARSSTTVTTTR